MLRFTQSFDVESVLKQVTKYAFAQCLASRTEFA